MDGQARQGGRWKVWALLAGGLLVGVVLGSLVFFNGSSGFGQNTESRLLPLTIGSQVPDFSLSQVDAADQRLSDLRGKPVIINFWATWCPPCVDEMPLLEQAAKKYVDQIVVLGVNSGEGPDVVQPFLDQNHITFPILLDLNEQVTDLYFVRNFPMTYFVDADGVLRAQHIGALNEKVLPRYLDTIGIEP